MPAIKLGLADYLSIWGRCQIVLRGGDRGVEADIAGLFPLSYGDLKSICLVCSGRGDGCVTTHYSAAELSRLLEAANQVCDRKGKQPELVVLRRLNVS